MSPEVDGLVAEARQLPLQAFLERVAGVVAADRDPHHSFASESGWRPAVAPA